MNIVHLTASPFFGGPERQMLGLGQHLGPGYRSVYVSFAEHGKARPFLEQAARAGFATRELRHNFPQVRRVVQELSATLRQLRADVVCSHGYKPDLLGWLAARRVGVPIIAVSRGWTGHTWRVKLYDALDRRLLRWMDAVVSVSAQQALKVRASGVPAERSHVIRNAIALKRFAAATPAARAQLQQYFATSCRQIVGAVGRLSPEKGFDVLLAAMPEVLRAAPGTGLLLFGEGPERAALARQIAALRLHERVVLAGFRGDLDGLIPALDALVLPSYTEGLPNVVLEAFAACVPVVATAVGGTPEVVDDGMSGYLVPPGDAPALAARLSQLLADEDQRRQMGQRGHERVLRDYGFAAQARQYEQLFQKVAVASSSAPRVHSPKFRALLDKSRQQIEETGGIPHDRFWSEVAAESREDKTKAMASARRKK